MNTRIHSITQELIDKFSTSKDLLNHLGMKQNGGNMRSLYKHINDTGLSPTPLRRYVTKGAVHLEDRKYKEVEKSCPICDTLFTTKEGSPKEKTVCSVSCSNSYFKSGANHTNYKHGKCSYRTTCFKVHERKCAVCEERKVLEVHHLDKNRDNNSIENLIPLCPTHHKYMHSKHKGVIEPKIREYLDSLSVTIAQG